MCHSLIPDVYIRNVHQIDIQKLQTEKGIKGIIIDLDNTLVPWGKKHLDNKTVSWINRVKDSELKICIVSNSNSSHVSEMGKIFGIPFYSSRYKPLKGPFLEAMKIMNTDHSNTAVIGDQIFTDVYGGKRLGLFTILVFPIKKQDALGTRLIYRKLERIIMSCWFKAGRIKMIEGNWPE